MLASQSEMLAARSDVIAAQNRVIAASDNDIAERMKREQKLEQVVWSLQDQVDDVNALLKG